MRLILLSALRHAFVGAILNSCGGNSASPKDSISAFGDNLYLLTIFSETNIKEHAPSFNLDALPPVILPWLFTENTGFSVLNLFSLNLSGSSSYNTVPFLVLIGNISYKNAFYYAYNAH